MGQRGSWTPRGQPEKGGSKGESVFYLGRWKWNGLGAVVVWCFISLGFGVDGYGWASAQEKKFTPSIFLFYLTFFETIPPWIFWKIVPLDLWSKLIQWLGFSGEKKSEEDFQEKCQWFLFNRGKNYSLLSFPLFIYLLLKLKRSFFSHQSYEIKFYFSLSLNFNDNWSWLWNRRIAHKHKFFLWLAVWNRFLTSKVYFERNLAANSVCSRWRKETDTTDPTVSRCM